MFVRTAMKSGTLCVDDIAITYTALPQATNNPRGSWGRSWGGHTWGHKKTLAAYSGCKGFYFVRSSFVSTCLLIVAQRTGNFSILFYHIFVLTLTPSPFILTKRTCDAERPRVPRMN